jgi:succinate dehydrogenase/fumarate reductase-like Fe-S protein
VSPDKKIGYSVPEFPGIRDYPDGAWACLLVHAVCPKAISVTKEISVMKRENEKLKK